MRYSPWLAVGERDLPRIGFRLDAIRVPYLPPPQCRRLFTVDLALEPALSRVVLEQICKIVRRNEIIYSSDFGALFEESLLNHRAKEKPPDASEAIDADCSHF